MIERANVKMALGSVHCFCDWGDMTGYDSEARIELTKWAFASRSKILVSHMFVSSKLILMGVTVAGIARRNHEGALHAGGVGARARGHHGESRPGRAPPLTSPKATARDASEQERAFSGARGE